MKVTILLAVGLAVSALGESNYEKARDLYAKFSTAVSKVPNGWQKMSGRGVSIRCLAHPTAAIEDGKIQFWETNDQVEGRQLWVKPDLTGASARVELKADQEGDLFGVFNQNIIKMFVRLYVDPKNDAIYLSGHILTPKFKFVTGTGSIGGTPLRRIVPDGTQDGYCWSNDNLNARRGSVGL